MPSAAQIILSIEKQMVRDFNAAKVERLLAHFHPRVVGFSSTRRERITGLAAMRKTFQYYLHATSRMKFAIAKPQVLDFDNTAIATFYWTVEMGTGRPRHVVRGRGSHVYAFRDGKWRIVHEHYSRAH